MIKPNIFLFSLCMNLLAFALLLVKLGTHLDQQFLTVGILCISMANLVVWVVTWWSSRKTVHSAMPFVQLDPEEALPACKRIDN